MLMDIIFYSGIAVSAIGAAGVCFALWLLLSKRGRRHISDLKQRLKEYDEREQPNK